MAKPKYIEAYKGYLLTRNPLKENEWHITRDGAHIGTCTYEQARAGIDAIVDEG